MEMKRTAFCALAVLFFLSCGGGGGGDSGKDALRMTADPNPVTQCSTCGDFHFQVTITETKGIGVEITSFRGLAYSADNVLLNTQNFTTAEFADWFNKCGGTGTYIAGGLTRCANLSFDGSAAYGILEVAGMDDLGKSVTCTCRVDFLRAGGVQRSVPGDGFKEEP